MRWTQLTRIIFFFKIPRHQTQRSCCKFQRPRCETTLFRSPSLFSTFTRRASCIATWRPRTFSWQRTECWSWATSEYPEPLATRTISPPQGLAPLNTFHQRYAVNRSTTISQTYGAWAVSYTKCAPSGKLVFRPYYTNFSLIHWNYDFKWFLFIQITIFNSNSFNCRKTWVPAFRPAFPGKDWAVLIGSILKAKYSPLPPQYSSGLVDMAKAGFPFGKCIRELHDRWKP